MKIGLSKIKERNPYILFNKWFKSASKKEISDPNAISLSTVNSKGQPNVRIVLMKSFNEDGLTFFTNSSSSKGMEIKSNRNIAACFYWKSIEKQVRIRGKVRKISGIESDAYFSSRDRKSQIGAWASLQSQPLKNRKELEKRFNLISKKYKNMDIPRPAHWGGFIIKPVEIEFWHNKAYRLHERVLFKLNKGKWVKSFLYP
tara:strand:- start:1256 stop:1858 length:603 start_codon:yes stop_codon:yes gene_type:complete